jgi:MYXO-CTERM domain-containing protein
MKRYLVGSLLVLVLGWMSSGGSAHAQIEAQGTVTVTNQSGGNIVDESIFNVTVIQNSLTTFSVNVAYMGDGGFTPISSVSTARFAFLGPGPALTGNTVLSGSGGTNSAWSSTEKNLPFGPDGDILFTKTQTAEYLGGPPLVGTGVFNGNVTLSEPLAEPSFPTVTPISFVDVTLSGGGSGQATLSFINEGNLCTGCSMTPDGASLSLMVPGLLSLGIVLRLRRRSTKRT